MNADETILGTIKSSRFQIFLPRDSTSDGLLLQKPNSGDRAALLGKSIDDLQSWTFKMKHVPSMEAVGTLEDKLRTNDRKHLPHFLGLDMRRYDYWY